jgi:hypothetical protein
VKKMITFFQAKWKENSDNNQQLTEITDVAKNIFHTKIFFFIVYVS